MKSLSLQEATRIILTDGVILFTKADCSICKTAKETLKNQNSINYYNLEIGSPMHSKLGIKTVPVAIKFKHGKQLSLLKGLNSLKQYKKLLR